MKEPNGSLDSAMRYEEKVLDLVKTDPQLKLMMPKPSICEALKQPGLSLERVIETVLEGYAERPALGERDYEIVQDKTSGHYLRRYLPSFTTMTYGELHARVQGLANSWSHHPLHRVRPSEFVCILGFASSDFVTTEIACVYAQAVSVPLQGSMGEDDLASILTDTNPAALVANINDLMLAVRLAISHGAVGSIIAMDYDERNQDERRLIETARAELQRSGLETKLTTIDELISLGEAYSWESLPPSPQGDDRMTTLIHSSGSTGKPKGAIYAESNAKRVWVEAVVESAQLPAVGICSAPLNHLIGRASVFANLGMGSLVYFTAKPDMSTLFEDIRIVRPTYLSFFPRILELVYQYYQNEVVRRTRAGEGDTDSVSKKVMEEMRSSFLGDRLLGGDVAGAPTTADIRDFMRQCFDVDLRDYYGSTESGGDLIMIDGRIQRPPITDYKLRDVPELGYYTTDKPFPRGELCFKSPNAIAGYFKRPEASEALYDEDGFQCTGDIVEELEPDRLLIIDRRKDILKLSQGEYVAVGNLGTVFESASAVIKQIYLYGNSSRAYLLAVVVPDMAAVRSLLSDQADEADIKSLIVAELQRIAKSKQLKTFEVPRDFIIEHESFSQENGLLSSVRKRLRPALKHKYGERLEAIYEALEKKRQGDLDLLKDPNCDLSVLEKLGKILEVELNIQSIDLTQSHTFAELGGDSLAATTFSISIERIFGVPFPADAILSPTGNPQRWAQALEGMLEGGIEERPSFTDIHGMGASTIYGKDLDISRFLDQETIESATALLPTAYIADKPQTVVVTGANGFLGRFICLEWLKKIAVTGGKVICLIRASDNMSAKLRFDEVFKGVDPALWQDYRLLADKHLEVLAGDVSESMFGLSAADFDRLARDVDRIVHPAALVNHRLGYEHLFAPNVVGTAEIIRLALSQRLKPIDFISTVAVESLLDNSNGKHEDSPLLESVTLSEDYAAGYAISKWAAEHLLHSAQQKFNFPVNVFRGGMMLTHQQYKGQINATDMFTRLLYSVIATGLAPESFYELNSVGGRTKAHYEGTPVDVVAAAVVGVSDRAHNDLRVYNVQNYHADDGCSLDAFIDWIEMAGYPVERIHDHGEWFKRIHQKLNALPEQQRQHSVLQLLGAFSHPYSADEALSGCDNFRELVRNLSIGPDVPHLSRAYINKCLNDMRQLGLVGEPAESELSANPL